MQENIGDLLTKLVMLIAVLAPILGLSQIEDDFSDGDLTNNPAWFGDISSFIVNSDKQVQLNADEAGSRTLIIPNSISDSMEWRFWIRLAFSPSTNNYARVYLASDEADLTGLLNGYYLQFGESGSGDAIELFQQAGLVHTSVCKGEEGTIASSFSLHIRLRRYPGGLWALYTSSHGPGYYEIEASGVDSIIQNSTYFGLLCNFTSSNSTRFYFDEIYAGPIQIDNTPPGIESVHVISPTQLDIQFSESVTTASALDISNYYVDNNIGYPGSAMMDPIVPALVHLFFQDSFPMGVYLNLTVSNISDTEGNILENSSYEFAYYEAQTFDIVINEIMADPSPTVDLPSSEYIELHNRTSLPVSLSGWQLDIGSRSITIPSEVITPQGFMIIADNIHFESFGHTLAILPSSSVINNTETTITLSNQQHQVIHSLFYSNEWITETHKKEGGWSVELIDPGNPCEEKNNWRTSIDMSGGTPGRQNSVLASNPDQINPEIHYTYTRNLHTIGLTFTEKMDSLTLINPLSFSIDHDIGFPDKVSLLFPEYQKIELILPVDIEQDVIYSIVIYDSLQDCSGNYLITNSSATFAIPELPMPMDIVINEILSDPPGDAVDYVEIYNRSDKAIDLNDLILASYDTLLQTLVSIKLIIDDGCLCMPGQYLVLSKSPDKVMEYYHSPGPTAFIKMASMPSLPKDQGTIVIARKNDEMIIDRFNYSSDLHFELLHLTKGISLERVHYDYPTADAMNWHSASELSGFGTPGYKNSQFNDYCLSFNDPFTISPEVFTPDNDGIDDILTIYYQMDGPGYVANITVFDAGGRLIKYLVRNTLVGTEGVFSWDGLNQNHQRATNGIYVVYFEIFNLNGITRNFKKVCVLG